MTSNIANDYYVSISGDDSNPGTLELPFRTIQHAASIVEAGDTVHIRGGIYREKISIENHMERQIIQLHLKTITMKK